MRERDGEKVIRMFLFTALRESSAKNLRRFTAFYFESFGASEAAICSKPGCLLINRFWLRPLDDFFEARIASQRVPLPSQS
jgi:hypothetical protein